MNRSALRVTPKDPESCRLKLIQLRKGNDNRPENLTNSSLFDLVLSGSELESLEFQEPVPIIDPIIPAESLALLHAPTGAGKTWLSLQMALSVALGRKFLDWNVPEAHNVLYVDGEMKQRIIRNRLKMLNNGKIPDTFHLLSSERLRNTPLNLNAAESQDRVMKCLEHMQVAGCNPKLIIFDNISSLCSGGNENNNSDLDSIIQWQIKLRHLGYSVIMVHHSSKGSGSQRGASRRTDIIDTHIALVPPSSPGKELKFTISFEKFREDVRPEKLSVELTKTGLNAVEWRFGKEATSKGPTKMIEYLHYIICNSPKTNDEIAAAFNVKKPRVSKLLSDAREKGYLSQRGLTLTKSGKEIVSGHFPE